MYMKRIRDTKKERAQRGRERERMRDTHKRR